MTSKKRKCPVVLGGPSEPRTLEAALVPSALAAILAAILVIDLDEDAKGPASLAAKVRVVASQPATPPATSNAPIVEVATPVVSSSTPENLASTVVATTSAPSNATSVLAQEANDSLLRSDSCLLRTGPEGHAF